MIIWQARHLLLHLLGDHFKFGADRDNKFRHAESVVGTSTEYIVHYLGGSLEIHLDLLISKWGSGLRHRKFRAVFCRF